MLSFLKERYADLNVIPVEDRYCSERMDLVNLYHHGDISVKYIEHKPDYAEYTLSFSTQHVHFERAEDLMDCIDDFLSEEYAALEFYKGDQRCFGGDIKTVLLEDLSLKKLADRMGYKPEYLIGFRFTIRSWSGAFDMDGYIDQEDGKAVLRK